MLKMNLKPVSHLDARFYLCQKETGEPTLFRDEKMKLSEEMNLGMLTLTLSKPTVVSKNNYE